MENLKKTEKTFFGQPRALLTLFQTELWERFSYYGMRAILALYLMAKVTDHNAGLGLSNAQAMAIMSIYGSLVFLSSTMGGWIADRLFGASKTLFIGGVLIMLGHLALAIPAGMVALFASIALIIIGTGMLKPNMSNMVGHLYDLKDPRRDTGFNIFYFGVNLGALLSPIIVGTIGQTYSFHLGFSLAAFGMALALFIYWFMRKRQFPEIGKNPGNPLIGKERTRFYIIALIALIVVVAGIYGIYALSAKNFVDNLVNVLSIIAILVPVYYYLRMFTSKEVTKSERGRLLAYIPMFLSGIVFWSIEEQGSSIIAVWGQTRTQLQQNIFGWHFTVLASWYQLLNPLFILILTPFFVRMWNKLGERQPSTIVKFGLGLMLTGASYMLLMLPGLLFGINTKANPLWLVLMFAIQMAGELLVSPVGLSVSTKLAPVAFQSQMVAMWLLADAGAQAINAQLAPFFKPATEVAYFGWVGGIGVIVGIILLFIKKPILNLMGDVR